MQFLYQPVTPFRVTQKFGADQVCFRKLNGKTEYRGKKTEETCQDRHGQKWQSIYRRMKGHNGLDLAASYWQPCYAMQNGIVAEISTEENEGLGVVLWHTLAHKDGIKRYKTRYWHFMSVRKGLKVGDQVKTGELIGYCGDTGRATGPHLHIDVKELDGNWVIKDYNNGYFGAFDPLPHMAMTPATKVARFSRLMKNLLDTVKKLYPNRN